MEDNAIIELFFARSEAAIAELDGKYGALCRSLAQRILSDLRDAEECVNDAYLGVWNTVPPRRPDPLRPYVCAIVRNRSIARYHANAAQKRDSRYDLSLQELEDCLGGPSAEDAVQARELVTILEGFLDGLSRENRTIFLRRYWFCDSYDEISRRVGLREKTVSVRLVRMREKLRNHLMKEGVLV